MAGQLAVIWRASLLPRLNKFVSSTLLLISTHPGTYLYESCSLSGIFVNFVGPKNRIFVQKFRQKREISQVKIYREGNFDPNLYITSRIRAPWTSSKTLKNEIYASCGRPKRKVNLDNWGLAGPQGINHASRGPQNSTA